MSRINLGLVVIVAVAGCGSSSDHHNPPPDGPTTHSDAPQGMSSVAPRAGLWDYSDTPVSNTCPPNTPTGQAGSFVIDQLIATSFRITPGDGTPAFPCSYDTAGFNCPDRLTHVEDLRPGVDAVVSVHAVASGSFSSSTHGTGNQTATATCTGSQCDALGVGAFPCMAKVQFIITAR